MFLHTKSILVALFHYQSIIKTINKQTKKLCFFFRVERSSDQVIKPLNLDALTKWVNNIPRDVLVNMNYIAPMLQILGYDPNANPPNYGQPDQIVIQKTKDLHKNLTNNTFG